VIPDGFALSRIDKLDTIAAYIESIAWEQRSFRMFGREHLTPRLTAWMGTGVYTYSGQRHEPAPMPTTIARLHARVEALTGARFNSVLANYYRDGRDSVAWHADDEPELGTEPMIASVSIGASRTFLIHHKTLRERTTLTLMHGDLLVMSGRSQLDYEHSVPKAREPVGPRINFTFRYIA
jgi:alkylated DNA repair dioxygenase AlkB